MSNTPSIRPIFIWAALACILSFSCAHPVAPKVDSGGAGAGGTEGYTINDLDGDWVGILYPNANVLEPFNFYFSAADSGIVSEAADSKGNQWLSADSLLTADILNDGRMMVEFNSMIEQNRLYLEGNMSTAMNELTGDYEYVNQYGIPIHGTFILARSTGNDYFADIDYSGSWSGGFGVGHNENMRQLVFVLDSDGTVIHGTMTHAVTGHEIHRYSVGSGGFGGSNLNKAIGRIDGFSLKADDGAIAICDFLLLDHELTLVGGTGTDSDVGEGTIEIRR